MAHSCPRWTGIPTPTCTRCRGRICTMDLTCDICAEWSSAQWEAFAKKRSYAERRRSRPSGSIPLASKTSPRARTSSEVKHPEASSSSSSLPSGGQAKSGGSRDAPDAASHEASSPPARPRSSERGGSVSGRLSGARERASASSAPLGAGEEEVSLSQRTPPACSTSSAASPRSSQHALRRGESGESSEVRSRSRSSRVSRSSDRGRIVGSALVTGPVDPTLALLPARGQAVESVGDGPRLGCCPPSSGRGVTGRSLRTVPCCVVFALARGETGTALGPLPVLPGSLSS